MSVDKQKYLQSLSDLYKRGYDAVMAEEYEKAVKLFRELISHGPDQAEPYDMCAACLVKLNRPQEALVLLDEAIAKNKTYTETHKRKIEILLALGRSREALECMHKALEQFPNDTGIKVFYGALCSKVGPEHYHPGAQVLEQVLEEDPENIDALNSMGAILSAAGKHTDAAGYFIKVLRIDPKHMPALLNVAGCFEKTSEPEMALRFYDAILEIEPGHPLSLCSKATIMANLGQSTEYIDMLEEGVQKLWEQQNLSTYVVFASNHVFYSHYVPGFSRKRILDIIKTWSRNNCSDVREKPRESFENNPDRTRKLRIGMLSNSFKRHPVTWMTLAMLRNIDRKQIEIYTYSDTAPGKKDDVTKDFFEQSDKVQEVVGWSNHEVVQKMRKDEVDILLELTGHSEGGRRLSITAERGAPVQVKWVGGLFNTSGVPGMDWIIGDHIEIPKGDDKWYTERVYRMPDDYVVYEPPEYVSDVRSLPALKNGYVTFGSMNNLTKINSFTIDLWVRILKAVPKSRLLMKVQKLEQPFAKAHIEGVFAKQGIGLDRLILEGGDPHKSFMETNNRIDIALDPHPYAGGLTTCEALWMGVPVLTLPGETFAGLHAATHLHNAGLPDWIAKDEDDYVDIAVRWSNDLESLAKLRAGLRDQVADSPLCDGPRFARNFEKAMRFMWEDWCDEKLGQGAYAKPEKEIKPLKPKKKRKKRK